VATRNQQPTSLPHGLGAKLQARSVHRDRLVYGERIRAIIRVLVLTAAAERA
jgi:hypothetical protein